MPTETEIQKIIELWNDNKSYGEIARELNGPKSTVQGWIQSLIKRGEIEPRTDEVRTNTKKATSARVEYCAEKRLALIDAGMKKLEEMLPIVDKPSGMRDWFVALGTAIDKRRLEDPQKSGEEDALEKLISAIDSHAEAIVSTQTGGSISKPSEDPAKSALRLGEERQN